MSSKRVRITDAWSVDYMRGKVYRERDLQDMPFSYTKDGGIKWKTDEVPAYIRKRVEREAKDMF